MKIFASCMECQKEFGHPSFEPIFAEYYEDRYSIIKCSRGHESALMVQNQKFEVLLDSGAAAYLDGYTIEATTSFLAALERFFEFCIRVFCKNATIDKREFDKLFKQVARQSERQLGAFLSLYLFNFGRSYEIKDNIVQFRNKVIHKGYIPSPDETETFASKIYDEIYNISTLLTNKFSSVIMEIVMEDMRARIRDIPEGIPVSTTWQSMLFSLGSPKKTFQEALSAYKDAKVGLDEAIPYMKALNRNIIASKDP